MIILGLTGGHDAGWCLVKDGVLLAAFEKERFTRIRHDSGEVVSLIKPSLDDLNLDISDIDLVATSEPVYKNTDSGLVKLGGDKYKEPNQWTIQMVEIFDRVLPCVSVPHHLSHAAYAHYTSNFKDNAVITWDGGGDFYTENAYASTTLSVWRDNKLGWLKRVNNSDFGSLWFTYSRAIFGDGNAAGKLMGLAAYGKDSLVDAFRNRFFAPIEGLLSGSITIKNCWPDYVSPPFIQKNCSWDVGYVQDIAYAIQAITEEAGLSIVQKFAEVSEIENLSLGGGVSLNGYLNAKIRDSKMFKNVHVPPSVHDGGICVGAALFSYYNVLNNPLNVKEKGSLVFLGREFDYQKTSSMIDVAAHGLKRISKEEAELRAAKAIVDGNVIAWCSERSEHGPRALGNRSILALPHFQKTKDILNNIKAREGFRPVAPVVLDSDASKLFQMDYLSPYMMYIVKGRKSFVSSLPSAFHVDSSARVQTVDTNSSLGRIVAHVRDLTGIGCVINTSFNLRGPIVDTPKDAIEVFEGTSIKSMYLNGFWVSK